MTFLTFIIIGLCMGSGILFSMYFGAKKYEKIKMSLILTIVSLGTRVLLAYLLAPSFGVEMIWWANCYWMDFSGYNWYCIWYKNRKMVQVKNTAFAVFFISYFD